MKDKMKNTMSLLLRFGLSGALLYYISRQIDFEATMEVLKSADITNLVYSLLIFFFIHYLLLVRWQLFIKGLDVSVEFLNLVSHFFVGLFGNLFLPTSIGGDVLKTIGLCKSSDEKPRVVASVLLDRLSGFAGISLVAVLSYIFGYSFIEEKFLAIPIALMGSGLLTIVTLLFNKTFYSITCKLLKGFPKLSGGLMTMHDDIQMLKNHKIKGFLAIGVGALGQVVFAIMMYFIAKALHQDIPIVYFLIFAPLINVVSIVPSIGGLGVREMGAVFLFGKIGVAEGVAASMTLLIFVYMVIIGLIGGAFYGVTFSNRRVQRNK